MVVFDMTRRTCSSTIKKFLNVTLKKSTAGRKCDFYRFYCSSLNSSIPSRSGFNDYEKENRTFSLKVPEKYNFASDIIDVWAEKEAKTGRKIPAFWFMYEDGRSLKWSFQELSENSKRAARFLEDFCGIRRGDNMIVMIPKLPEFWLLNIAAIRSGIVLSPSSAQLKAKDLRYRIETFQPKCIVAHESVADVVDESTSTPSTVNAKVLVSNRPNTRKGWLDFGELQKCSADYKAADTSSNETMMVFFTSGTSGLPKMVEHTHFSYGHCLGYSGKYIMDLTEKSISWNLSDPGWAKTAYGSIFGPWIQGSCVFIHEMPRFSPSTLLKTLSEVPIDTLCAAPTMFRMLVQEDLSKFRPMNLSHCISGGEALTAEVIQSWHKHTNVRIYEGYGQTETVMLIGMYKCLKYKPGSIGKPPPGVEIAILDDNFNELGPNEQGQIAVKRRSFQTVGLFKGYKGDPEKTASRFIGDYFLTGDLAYYDDEGYFWFVGRADDVINSAGYRIGPYEVESALMEHPFVVEVGVTSSPDELRGEIVTAYIVLQNKHKNTDKESLTKELQEHVKTVTAPYKYPRKIIFVDELPKTVSGKIKRSELKKMEWQNKK